MAALPDVMIKEARIMDAREKMRALKVGQSDAPSGDEARGAQQDNGMGRVGD